MFPVIFWQTDLCGGEHGVLIKTEYSISGDGVVGQKTVAYNLVSFAKQRNSKHTNKQIMTGY